MRASELHEAKHSADALSYFTEYGVNVLNVCNNCVSSWQINAKSEMHFMPRDDH